MKLNHRVALPLLVISLLGACAGPAPKPTPTAAPKPPAPARPVLPRFYIITFDAKGVAHDRTGAVVSRERALKLMAKGEIDRHTGIRIEVPAGIADREKNIEAFARAQRIAQIFDLLGFEAIVVALAKH